MDSRKIILLVGALVVAAITAFMARSLIAGSSAPQAQAQMAPPPVAGTEVLVATKTLPVGTILDATSFKYQPWPTQMVGGAYFVKKDGFDIKTLQGTVVRSVITAGQPLTQGALVKPGDRGFLAAALTPGMRAVTFPVENKNSVAGFVFPGDHIDLMLTQKVAGGGDGPPLNVAETIMKNLRVLATDQRTTTDVDDQGKTVVKSISMVTIEATPSIAEKISVARALGDLSVVLRPLADSASDLDAAIADGSVKVPDGKDPKAEKAFLDNAASQPSAGKTTFATGADVSRFQRRTVPGKAESPYGRSSSGGNGYPGAAANMGPTVRIARGNNVTEIPVGEEVMLNRLNRAGWPMAAALAIAATGAATPAAAPAQSAASRVVEVDTNQGRLVTLARPISDVFVANDTIADIQVRSPTQIYVFGKAPGETTVSATTKTGQVVFSATVRVGNNFGSINQMLKLAMPEAQLSSYTMNGVVLLTGTVLSPQDAQEAESLVQAFVGDKTKVISRLKTATPLQVNLQVKIAEVSKTFAKNIGSNLSTVDGTGGFKFGIGQGRAGYNTQYTPDTPGLPPIPLATGFTTATGASLITKQANGATLGAAGRLFGLNVLAALDLGETNGQVVTLAQPNLSALSGETASFLVGGEIPIPLSTGLGAVSVEYKQYGISLAYTPTVLSDGRISLRVRPEVSELTAAGSVTIGGTVIPGLSTRRAETTVELGSGQSMVIGGLISNSTNNTIDKTPGLGNVPILGALFRSTAWKRNESELIIVVTPYLVKPVNANDVVLPTDGYKAPTDLGRVFMGELGGGTTGGDRAKPTLAAPNAGAPSVGANAPVPVAPNGPASDAKRDEKAVLPKKSKKDAGAPTPGFSQ